MAGPGSDWESEEVDHVLAAFLDSEEAAWVPEDEAAVREMEAVPERRGWEQDDGELPGPSRREAWRNEAPLAEDSGQSARINVDVLLMEEPEPSGAAPEDMAVWIVGHLFIHWAHRHACGRPYGPNLDLQHRGVRVHWLGRRGMLWDELIPCVLRERDRLAAPRALEYIWGEMIGARCRASNLLAWFVRT
ncbi:uncharacterized protein LOC115091937 isoform X2 [Rhinatrema bivittatum]|uniref:uncharacterized protein LOC115091937 isoform X2 n=1 Tax=Rhinatrema bivittatum TaxID=194408 RepID=UPI00112D027C|nr:uncharacterized protein LOC115091937 isoform X2 [Rhinatrema bivittatum]